MRILARQYQEQEDTFGNDSNRTAEKKVQDSIE